MPRVPPLIRRSPRPADVGQQPSGCVVLDFLLKRASDGVAAKVQHKNRGKRSCPSLFHKDTGHWIPSVWQGPTLMLLQARPAAARGLAKLKTLLFSISFSNKCTGEPGEKGGPPTLWLG